MAEQGAAMEEETDGASVAVDTPNHPAAMEEENATIMGVPEFEDEEALAEEALAEEQPADRPSVSGVTIEHDTSWVAGGGVGYHMQVHSEDGGRWMCVRRYSEFAGIREEVVARCQQPSRRRALLGLPFPEKRMFGSADLDTVKERQRDLERWMNGAIAICPADADILAFLAPDSSRGAGAMTPGGSGSFSGASGALGPDEEDWAELEKVRQLRESLLRGQLPEPGSAVPGSPGMSGLEPEPEPEQRVGDDDDDFLEMLIREAAADPELESEFALPPLREAGLDASAAPPASPSSHGRPAFAADLSKLETPPRPGGNGRGAGGRTPPHSAHQHGLAHGGNGSGDGPEQIAYDAASLGRLLRAGGKQSLQSVCAVLDRVVPLLDVPQKHTPRRRRRLLEERVEKLLELLRPTESGSGLQQRWAAAAALMELEPNVASELAEGLAKLAALPTQSAYAGYAGLSASAVVTLASVLRTLELAAAGRGAGNLLEQEVMKRLSSGGEGAVACVAAALEHCLALVDIPQAGVSRRYRRALEHDILEAQSCLERGLGFKLAGRGLQPPLLDALVVAIVQVQQLVPSELQQLELREAEAAAAAVGESPMRNSNAVMMDCTPSSVEKAAAAVVTSGLLSERTRRDSEASDDGGGGGGGGCRDDCFAAMQRLLRLLVRPETDPEVLEAREDEARVTEQRVARRREQRITAVLARKSWGAADEDEHGGYGVLPAATERLRQQQEEEAAAMLRMRLAEADLEMKERQKVARQARLAQNRQRRARRSRRRRWLTLCFVAAAAVLALVLRSKPVVLQRIGVMLGPAGERFLKLFDRVRAVVSPSLARAHVMLMPSLARANVVATRVRVKLGAGLIAAAPALGRARRLVQPAIEAWAQSIDRLVDTWVRGSLLLVLLGKRLRTRVLVVVRRRLQRG